MATGSMSCGPRTTYEELIGLIRSGVAVDLRKDPSLLLRSLPPHKGEGRTVHLMPYMQISGI